MVMSAKPLDLKQSYVPGDPNAFPNNLEFTRSEDDPRPPTPPISLFEGHNFLPTDYGVRSYFGLNALLDVPVVPSRCDELITLRSSMDTVLTIALCEDGIWTKDPSLSAGAWVQETAFALGSDFDTEYDVLVHRRWTQVRIGNDNYFYQRGRPNIYKIDDSFVWTDVSPSFITMASQVGIFQAGGRMGIWDTLNAVANSALSNFADFTPSLETLANVQSFRAVVGNIVTILKHGDGFVIYSTGSITSVQLDLKQSGLLWEAVPVSKTKGIRHAGEVSTGVTNLEHYVYTTEGMIVLKNFNAFTRQHEINNALTSVIDFLREDHEIVTLKVMQGRYVFFQLINPNYIDGITSTYETSPETVGAVPVVWNSGDPVTFNDGTPVYFTGSVTIPSTVFNIPAGQSVPMYPTYAGALVWDIILEKWGKFKGSFRLLTDLAPGDSLGDPDGFTTFGMNVGILQDTGVIRIFDNNPSDSLARWGKIGYKRQGMTQLLEVNIDFRSPSTGVLEIESSLNGRDFNSLFSLSTSFNLTRLLRHTSDFSCRWHTIAVRGQWDLQSISIAAKIAGKR